MGGLTFLVGGDIVIPRQALAGDVASGETDAILSVPLRRDELRFALLQPQASRGRSYMPVERDAALRAILARIDTIQAASDSSDHVHIGAFPERELQPWTAAEAAAVAIDLNGPELRALTESARKHRCYLTLECLARDALWPGLIIRMGILLGPNGRLGTQWQHTRTPRDQGSNVSFAVMADVRDTYIARFGPDAMLPVFRTDVGNIALLAEDLEPQNQAISARKGAEVMIFSSATSNSGKGAASAASAFQVHGIGQVRVERPCLSSFSEAADAGSALVAFDPQGEMLPAIASEAADAVIVRLKLGKGRDSARS